MSKDGGPAFPADGYYSVQTGSTESGYTVGTRPHYGMSLRDYFAAAAMQALLWNAPKSFPERLPEHNLDITTFAYRYADQMIAERDK